MSKLRVRILDEVSAKRILVQTKKGLFRGWDTKQSMSYRFESRMGILTQATELVQQLMEEDVVLFDSKDR